MLFSRRRVSRATRRRDDTADFMPLSAMGSRHGRGLSGGGAQCRRDAAERDSLALLLPMLRVFDMAAHKPKRLLSHAAELPAAADDVEEGIDAGHYLRGVHGHCRRVVTTAARHEERYAFHLRRAAGMGKRASSSIMRMPPPMRNMPAFDWVTRYDAGLDDVDESRTIRCLPTAESRHSIAPPRHQSLLSSPSLEIRRR